MRGIGSQLLLLPFASLDQLDSMTVNHISNTRPPLEKLSLEILLHIQSFLSDWDDRFHFAKINERVWYISSRLRLSTPLRLDICSTNVLKIMCSQVIQLPDQHLPRLLLASIIQYSYAARRFHIPSCRSNQKSFAHYFIGQISKRHDAKKITIAVDYQHAAIWQRATAIHHSTVKIAATGIEEINDDHIDTDLFVTPPEAERAKRTIKELYVKAGKCVLRSVEGFDSNDEHSMIPLGAVSILDKGAKYERVTTSATSDDPRLSPSTTIDITDAHDLVRNLGDRYMEMVILFGQFWFLVTSFDVFIHKSLDIDDCANKTDRQYESHPKACIISKSMHGQATYHELSVFIANVELVAVGGFFGKDDHPEITGFLGSSIKHLPVELRQPTTSMQILVRMKSAESSVSNRHLRQYAKMAAFHTWSFHSLRFATRDFYPVNPLAFGDHAVTINGLGGIPCRLASRFFLCVAKRRVCGSDIEYALMKAVSDPMLEKSTKNMKPITFRKISKSATLSSSTTGFMKTAIDAMTLLEKDLGKNDSICLQSMPVLSEMVVKLLNAGYADRLTTANKTATKLYASKYRFNATP